ncbi:unnamed protein product [Protopolystoma xenopodis]|uniref:Uncharacterized protein n=1 Tax=Protopolystoma xenopodis TaxID=117903 RepID=A0A3S5AZF1_9PLAT|nr:unnamed protein product [Protopolystoma xenopodis]
MIHNHFFTFSCQLENTIAVDSLEVAKLYAEASRLKEKQRELDDEIASRNGMINKLESEIHQANIQVERKQGAIDLLNKRLESLMLKTGVRY